MRQASRRSVERWWSTVLGVPADRLWSGATSDTHVAGSPLRRYGGWWVVWSGSAVHVTRPAGALPPPDDLLADPVARVSVDAWRALAADRGLRVVGPSVHAYLDRAPSGPTTRGVAGDDPGVLEGLRRACGADAWEESGFGGLDPAADRCLVLRDGASVVAAANLTPYDGAPRDVGVLVDPRCRGRGLGSRVGAAAAAWAVEQTGLARWRSQADNLASRAIAGRLGFEPWCTQLALR